MRRKKDKSNGITALYERLSRDDDNEKIFENIANHCRNSFFDFCSADMYWTVC